MDENRRVLKQEKLENKEAAEELARNGADDVEREIGKIWQTRCNRDFIDR